MVVYYESPPKASSASKKKLDHQIKNNFHKKIILNFIQTDCVRPGLMRVAIEDKGGGVSVGPHALP